MATPDVRNALRIDGRLCWNPSNLAGSYPFGGTALGLVHLTRLRVVSRPHLIRAEEYGGAPIDAIYPAEEYVFGCTLASWDKSVMITLMLDGTTGGTTGRALLRDRVTTNGVRAGELVSTNAGILYFAPIADQYPGVLFHNALPLKADDAEWPLHLAERFGIPLLFVATPDSSGRTVSVGLRQDLTL